MEDSGFDSGDRVVNFMQNYQNHLGSSNLGDESSTSNEEEILDVKHLKKSMTSNSDNIDNVAFRNPSIINPSTTTTQVLIDQSKSHHLNEHNKKLSNINQCKSLHRKLEQKVERAKKNFLHNEKFNQLENDADSKKSLTNLISIDRLPFPRNNNIENQPLVEYKSDNSDDEEVATFFPVHKKLKKSRMGRNSHQQLRDVDTFSIQEMTIISESDGNEGDKSSDEDDDCDSQLNLELPPRTIEWSFFDKFRQMFCCSQASHNIF